MTTATATRRQPPGPRGRFLFGHLFEFFSNPLELFRKAQQEHGDVVRLRLLPWKSTYLLSHPDHVEQVLRHDHRNYRKDQITRSLSTFLGNGLLTSEGDFWKRQRHLLQPGFQRGRVDRYAEIMVDFTKRMMQGWQDGALRDVHVDMMQLTLEIVSKALFDADVGDDVRVVGAELDFVLKFYRNPLNWPPIRQWIPTPALIRFRRARRRLYRVIDRVIQQRRDSARDAGDLLGHLLQALDEEGTQMTDQQLRDELITLMLAGHETTALALTYAIYLLSNSPDAEQKLLDELGSVLGGRAPTIEDVPKLGYVDKVIREAMRLYPPAWVLGREAVCDVEIGGYFFPKGTELDMSQWVVHRDPRWYDEPDQFRPERWTDEMKERLPRCAYFPFGDGPRVCVGSYFALTEAMLVLATLYQKHRFEPAMTEPMVLEPAITARPKHPVMMRVVPS